MWKKPILIFIFSKRSLKPILVTLGTRQEYSPQMGCHSHLGQFSITNPHTCFWTVGGYWRTWKKSRQTQREYGKLHRDSDLSSRLNQGPWSCEAAVLPSAPLCHPKNICTFLWLAVSIYHKLGKHFCCICWVLVSGFKDSLDDKVQIYANMKLLDKSVLLPR